MGQDQGGSVTGWIKGLEAGDSAAAQALWERYFTSLTRIASQRLAGRRAGSMEDEEDAALSAFNSFCQGVVRGRFPKLDDRDDLWRLLMVITIRKVSAQVERERARKRGGGHAALPMDLDAIIAGDPTPEFVAVMSEQYDNLLEKLGDDDLRQVAIHRMEGYDRAEIAQLLGCAVRTVARRMELIRKTWAAETE
jgi:DNA-directed RNA polymerase specialized sigma24 family protein